VNGELMETGVGVRADPRPVVHLELHTGDRSGAHSLYRELFGWRSTMVETSSGSYLALDFGAQLGGGIVECGIERSAWLPYVDVDDVAVFTERARRLGARVLLEPREGPAGWRSVLATTQGGELGLWQAKGES
jgi:uncharacterized protein